MNEEQRQEILNLLSELAANVGDARGRDGEYLSDQISVIEEKIEDINVKNS
jgi:CRISPR/Cas system CSM-associated protein Csm2 small subunit